LDQFCTRVTSLCTGSAQITSYCTNLHPLRKLLYVRCYYLKKILPKLPVDLFSFGLALFGVVLRLSDFTPTLSLGAKSKSCLGTVFSYAVLPSYDVRSRSDDSHRITPHQPLPTSRGLEREAAVRTKFPHSTPRVSNLISPPPSRTVPLRRRRRPAAASIGEAVKGVVAEEVVGVLGWVCRGGCESTMGSRIYIVHTGGTSAAHHRPWGRSGVS
jgi:hypothetical protein